MQGGLSREDRSHASSTTRQVRQIFFWIACVMAIAVCMHTWECMWTNIVCACLNACCRAKKKDGRIFVSTKKLRGYSKLVKSKVGYEKGQHAYLWDAKKKQWDRNVAHIINGRHGKKVGHLLWKGLTSFWHLYCCNLFAIWFGILALVWHFFTLFFGIYISIGSAFILAFILAALAFILAFILALLWHLY